MSSNITMPNLLTTAEAARVLRCSRGTVYRLIDEGKLPALRVGGRLRIDAGQLERWLYGEDRDAA
jgi:excisionase family DNA binding protein